MRAVVLILVVALTALAGCFDPGLRDRSLMRQDATIPIHPDVFGPRRKARIRAPDAATLLAGLKTDELAPLYPADAKLVVRCADLATLQRHAVDRLSRFASLLPRWGLPGLPFGTLLRVHCQVPDSVLLDRLHPFALVETQAGWLAIVPIIGKFEDTERLRRIDQRYCVAGSPEAVRSYAPSQRTSHYLNGEFSVMAQGAAVADLGRRLTEAAAALQITLPGITNLPGATLDGVNRIDVAVRFLDSGIRAELRIAPDYQRAPNLTARIGSLKARGGRALGWLPADGIATVASGCDLPSWLALTDLLGLPILDAQDPERAAILRDAFATLGNDAAACWQLDSDGAPVLIVAAELMEPDRRIANAFLAGAKMTSLLRELAKPGSEVVYRPVDFEHRGIAIGTIEGAFSRELLDGVRKNRDLGGPFARLFSDKARVHIALAGNRLCITVGERSRSAMESLLDRIAGSTAALTSPSARSNDLRRMPLFEATVDLAAFLRGSRPGGLAGTRERLNLEIAVSRDGGALRVTARLPLARIAAVLPRTTPAAAAPPERD